MNRRLLRATSQFPLALGVGLILFSGSCRSEAQSASGATQPKVAPTATAAPAAGRRAITIDVEVTDKLGHHLRGLQTSDFSLLDNNQPQKLVGFRSTEAVRQAADQVRVVIVVDMINSDWDTVSREREQLMEFLAEDNGHLAHPTSVAMLTDDGLKIERLTTMDGNAMEADLNGTNSVFRLIGRNTGFYGDVERMEMSLSQVSQLAAFESEQPGRKLFLTISPGWPLLDWVGMQEDMKQRAWTFDSDVQLTNGLRDAHITLYALQPYELGRVNPFYYQTYLKPPVNVGDAIYPDLALQVLAEHSGGRVLVTGHGVTEEVNDAMRDANAYYELSFDAPASTHPNDYHSLQVKVDKADATVRTYAGYYLDTHVTSSTKK